MNDKEKLKSMLQSKDYVSSIKLYCNQGFFPKIKLFDSKKLIKKYEERRNCKQD